MLIHSSLKVQDWLAGRLAVDLDDIAKKRERAMAAGETPEGVVLTIPPGCIIFNMPVTVAVHGHILQAWQLTGEPFYKPPTRCETCFNHRPRCPKCGLAMLDCSNNPDPKHTPLWRCPNCDK